MVGRIVAHKRGVMCMIEEWDKLCEGMKKILDEYNKYSVEPIRLQWQGAKAMGDKQQEKIIDLEAEINELVGENDMLQEENKNQKIITDSYIQLHKLIERVECLDGLTKGDVELITRLQVENKQLRRDTKDLAELGSDDLKKRVAYQKENEALKIVTAKLFNKLVLLLIS